MICDLQLTGKERDGIPEMHCQVCGRLHYSKHPPGKCAKECVSRGLGDTVAKVIHRVTRGHAKPCGGCKKRQNRLNEMFPYTPSQRDPDPDDGRAG